MVYARTLILLAAFIAGWKIHEAFEAKKQLKVAVELGAKAAQVAAEAQVADEDGVALRSKLAKANQELARALALGDKRLRLEPEPAATTAAKAACMGDGKGTSHDNAGSNGHFINPRIAAELVAVTARADDAIVKLGALQAFINSGACD